MGISHRRCYISNVYETRHTIIKLFENVYFLHSAESKLLFSLFDDCNPRMTVYLLVVTRICIILCIAAAHNIALFGHARSSKMMPNWMRLTLKINHTCWLVRHNWLKLLRLDTIWPSRWTANIDARVRALLLLFGCRRYQLVATHANSHGRLNPNSVWVCRCECVWMVGQKNAEVWSGYFECLNVAIIVYRAASYQCKSIYLYQFAWHTIQKSRVSLPGVPTILPHMYHTSAVLRCVSRTQFPSGAARAHSVFFPLFLHNRSFHRSIWTWTQYAVVLGVSRVMCCFDEQFLFVCIYYQSSVFRMDRRVLDLLSSQRMLSVMSSTVCGDGTKATSIGNIHTECTESTVHDLASFFNSPNDCWKFPSDHPWA